MTKLSTHLYWICVILDFHHNNSIHCGLCHIDELVLDVDSRAPRAWLSTDTQTGAGILRQEFEIAECARDLVLDMAMSWFIHSVASVVQHYEHFIQFLT